MSDGRDVIKLKIRAYIVDKQRVHDKDLSDDNNLFEEGIVDSMGAFELASFLEKTFDVKFEEEHFFDKRFRSIDGMASLIEQIRSGNGS